MYEKIYSSDEYIQSVFNDDNWHGMYECPNLREQQIQKDLGLPGYDLDEALYWAGLSDLDV